MGVAIFGDSATAHFRIPPSFLTAANFTSAAFANLNRILDNELDFPQLSWSTGHVQPRDYVPEFNGTFDSVYMRLRENNLCNHNDY